MGPGETLTGKGLDVQLRTLTSAWPLFRLPVHRARSCTVTASALSFPSSPATSNWMTACRGIAHSERTDARLRTRTAITCSGSSPGWRCRGRWRNVGRLRPPRRRRLAACSRRRRRALAPDCRRWLGLEIASQTYGALFYADATLQPGAVLPLPDDHEERGAYIVQGSIDVAGTTFEAGHMLLFRRGDRLALHAGPNGARLLLLGGAVMDSPRHIFWNLVSSSRERIEQARQTGKPAVLAPSPATNTSSSRCRGADGARNGQKRQKIWTKVPPRPVRANRRSRQSIIAACETFIVAVLKPRFLPKISPTAFNYQIDIRGESRARTLSLHPALPAPAWNTILERNLTHPSLVSTIWRPIGSCSYGPDIGGVAGMIKDDPTLHPH